MCLDKLTNSKLKKLNRFSYGFESQAGGRVSKQSQLIRRPTATLKKSNLQNQKKKVSSDKNTHSNVKNLFGKEKTVF